MIMLRICPICKLEQDIEEPYIDGKTELGFTYGEPCKICLYTKLHNHTLLMEEQEINDIGFPDLLIIADADYKNYFKISPPPEKYAIVEKGFLLSIGYYKGIFFGTTKH